MCILPLCLLPSFKFIMLLTSSPFNLIAYYAFYVYDVISSVPLGGLAKWTHGSTEAKVKGSFSVSQWAILSVIS